MSHPNVNGSRVVPFSQIRIGQRFSWIPAAWYGPCRLIEKTRRVELGIGDYPQYKLQKTVVYDIKFEAAVVNPPGVEYRVRGDMKVRRLKNGTPQR